jgi:hypothetical protein
MDFTNINEARTYVREMSIEATEQIGDQEVWEHEPTRAVAVVSSAEDLLGANPGDSADEWRLLGTVAEVLS